MFRLLWIFSFILVVGCSEIPYTGPVLTVDHVDRYLDATGEDTVCLQDGFDSVCIKVIEGPKGVAGKDGRDGRDGKDGKDGKDGTTFLMLKEVPIEIIVEKIVEKIVIKEVPVEVPVEVIVEKIVERVEYVEVPVEVFVTETVEIIREVVEVEVIREVPTGELVEVVKEVYVEVPVFETTAYQNWDQSTPQGMHPHQLPHTHGSYGTHTHFFIHPDGEVDDWDALHQNLH